jgi:hypothetical protein
VPINLTLPECAVTFLKFSQIVDDGADGEEFLIHGADNANLHLVNPEAS